MLGRAFRVAAPVAALIAACGCGNVVVVPGGSSGTATGTAGTGGNTTASSGGGGAMGGTGGAGGSTGTAGTGPSGCQGDLDCEGEAGGPLCDPVTGLCVACLPMIDPAADCGIGEWCDTANNACEPGCTGDADCLPGDTGLTCDAAKHVCVGCLDDSSCGPGTVCTGQACLPGCNVNHPCEAGATCCGDTCHFLDKEVDNCGACGNICLPLPHFDLQCLSGQCIYPECSIGYADCDGLVVNGCEHNMVAEGPCVCAQGTVESCYSGAPGTEGMGPCHAGTRVCDASGLGWGPCMGQVLPAAEVCANGVDEDCNGVTDNSPDVDFDGWTVCDGDCDDLDPFVNPGAFEDTYGYADVDNDPGTPPVWTEGTGNGKDDDCNPATPDVGLPAPCSAVAVKTGVTALDLAKAMDVCQTATLGAPKSQQTWGLLSAALLRADATPPSAAQLADLQNAQTAVLDAFGASAPQRGATMVGLSTGRMRVPGDADYTAPSPGTDLGWAGSPPAQFMAAHGGQLPSSSGCNGACPSGSGANDGVVLRLVIRTPSNGKVFSFKERFFTAEYPGNVCSGKNDFFLALLGAPVGGLPADKNVSFDSLFHLISVSNLFFEACSPSGCSTCPSGTADLAGTGMPGATTWLATDVPAQPGATMTLDLTLFDVSDGAGDSVVLIDGFHWVVSNFIPDH